MSTAAIASPFAAPAAEPAPAYVAGGLDMAELYAQLARPLERIVSRDLGASDAVVEDACQAAWSRLIPRAHGVPRQAALAWLATTARREGVKLMQRQGRDLSLESELETAGDVWLAAVAAGPHEQAELRDRLAAVAALPERQRRLLWLSVIGLSHAEIAACTGGTSRAVERQLIKARRRLRESSA